MLREQSVWFGEEQRRSAVDGGDDDFVYRIEEKNGY